MGPSYIEFEVNDDQRFERLVAVVNALREAKQSDDFRDDEYWKQMLDEKELAHFWWPTAEEVKAHTDLWYSTPVAERLTDPRLQTPWDLGSLVDAFYNAEFEIVGCRRMSEEYARLEFQVSSHPYGGTECMTALIEAFDFKVTSVVE